MSQEERDYLTSITDIARMIQGQGRAMFDVGLPAYQQATDYFQKLLGFKGRAGVQEAIAPQAEQVAGAFRGARSQVLMSGMRGPARDIALADLARSQAGEIGNIAGSQAAQGAQGLLSATQLGVSAGLQGEQAAGAILKGVQEAVTQNRQFGESLGMQWSIAALQARTTKEVASMQASINWAQLAQERDLAQQQIAQRSHEFESTMGLNLQQLQEQIRQFNAQMHAQGQQQKGSLFGSIFKVIAGVGASFIPGIGPALSGAILGSAVAGAGGGGNRKPKPPKYGPGSSTGQDYPTSYANA